MLCFSADMDVKLNIFDTVNNRLIGGIESDGKTLIRILVALGTLVHQVSPSNNFFFERVFCAVPSIALQKWFSRAAIMH